MFSGKCIRNDFLNRVYLQLQDQALRTNSIKAKINKQPVSPKCRLCGTKEETACTKLAQKQYKGRQDNVARRVHWELCKKHGQESSDQVV